MHNQDDIDKKVDELANIGGDIIEIIHKNQLPPKIAIVLLVHMLRSMTLIGMDEQIYRNALAGMMRLPREGFRKFFARQIIAAYFSKGERN